ncbi:MAG: 5'/3'-nucleotidase SurE [Myxococcota bacterium]
MNLSDKTILITNDDGIYTPNIKILAAELQKRGMQIKVAAPINEQSAVSHCISLHQPLRVREIKTDWFAITGTPADCVYLGIYHLLDKPPDLVISGINNGFNLGSDLFYSGTFAGAMEAVIRGIPGLAISAPRNCQEAVVRGAAKWAWTVGCRLLELEDQIAGYCFNLNHPDNTRVEQIEITDMGERKYKDQVVVRQDPKGENYYWLGGPGLKHTEGLKGGEINALNTGHASLTPVHLNISNLNSDLVKKLEFTHEP